MKITIDTKEDSKEEIKKVIAMLQAMVDGPVHIAPTDIFGDSSSTTPTESSETQQSGDLFSLFSDNPPAPASKQETDDEPKVKVIRY